MEKRNDIYLHLNFKLNIHEYPNNTAQGLSNITKPSLSLDSTYEVALQKQIFNPDIYNMKKVMKIIQFFFMEIMLQKVFQWELLVQETFQKIS